MKKTLPGMFCILFMQTALVAGEGIRLNARFLPGQHYEIIQTNRITQEISFQADEETMEQMAAMGLGEGTLIETIMSYKVDLKTGQADHKEGLPLVIHFREMETISSMNGMEMPSMAPELGQTVVYGRSGDGLKIHIDSIGGLSMDQQIISMLEQMTGMMLQGLEFPDHKIRPGESFQQSIPMDFPVMGGMPIQVNTVNSYRLKKVEKPLAYFDLVQTSETHIDSPSGPMTAKGMGSGEMVFNLSAGFLHSLQIDTQTQMSMETPEFDMLINMHQLSETRVSLSGE